MQPFQAFAFLDIDHPVVAWGVYRGVLVSAQAGGTPPECPVSVMFAGIVQHQNNARLHNELLIELVRSQRFQAKVSRLAGMFFFTDVVQANAAVSWGGHFCQENLAELEVHPIGPTTKVDANWITYAQVDAAGRLNPNATAWIERYWAGDAFNDAPVWETLAHGRAVIYGTDLRQRAYERTATAFPDALDTLEVARLAAAAGSDLGQSTAWITRAAPDRLQLAYYLDMRDAENPDFLKRLAAYDGPKNIRDLAPGKDTFGLPDFRPYSCEFSMSQVNDAPFESQRIHRNELGI
jgi:hypothetical protein